MRDWIRGYNLGCRAEKVTSIDGLLLATDVASIEFNKGFNQRCLEIARIEKEAERKQQKEKYYGH